MNVKYTITIKGNNPKAAYKKGIARRMAGALNPLYGCIEQKCTIEDDAIILTYADYSEYSSDGEIFSILVKFED